MVFKLARCTSARGLTVWSERRMPGEATGETLSSRLSNAGPGDTLTKSDHELRWGVHDAERSEGENLRRGNQFGGDAQARNVVQVAGNVFGDIRLVDNGPETPRTTPSPTSGFVDRHDVLAAIEVTVADPSHPPRVVVLTGPPGVGKRAAARWYARQARERFPGGDLYVDCDHFGASYGRADIGGMIAACLSSLGVADAFVPASLAARANCLRARTARRPVLVVVENATEAAQVRALTPKADGSLLLATTHHDLTELHGSGAVFFDVTRLDETNSLVLFAAVSGMSEKVARSSTAGALVRLCAGLPLAICVAAGRVASTPGMDLGDLEAELADERRRLAGLSLGGKPIVSSTFSAAYERLPEPVQYLYRVLGLLPGPIVSAESAAAAATISVQQARQCLDLLAQSRLMTPHSRDRFQFHELIRLHAAERAQEIPQERREAISQQFVDHCLSRVAQAVHAIMGERTLIADVRQVRDQTEPFGGRDSALAWLDAERPNLTDVVRTAVAAGLDERAWQLAEVLTGYYLNHRHLGDWITTSTIGIEAARRTGNERAEARLRMLVSRAYADQNDWDRADAESRQAVELAQRGGDVVLQASAWEFRGRYLDREQPEAAFAAYQRALDLNIQAEEWRGVALTLYFCGRTLRRLGQPRRSADALNQAEDLLTWLGDGRMRARVSIDRGAALAEAGAYDEARAILQRAAQELGGLHYAAEAEVLLAGLAGQQGDEERAREHLRAAWSIYHRAGHPEADVVAARLSERQA
ncbi:hypothetical protein HII36_09805 [Nonomuraea sp. NN258]|uniref:tetratricopeptide repeat protein n=1 Tax=Nonomuraea antri TaxID=2730852 RepID=UPI0015680273|nr:tetratricopeptide repeat protein [Nonomuraea antri]NRQ32130.1 hypothetical protein [Nonomuraea antri]